MTKLFAVGGLAVLLLAGCASQPQPGAQNRNLPPPGPAQPVDPTVTVLGNVTRQVIPWYENLTLMRAYSLAGYQGAAAPDHIIVVRRGEQPMFFEFSTLRRGQDMLLEAGDRIQIVAPAQ